MTTRGDDPEASRPSAADAAPHRPRADGLFARIQARLDDDDRRHRQQAESLAGRAEAVEAQLRRVLEDLDPAFLAHFDARAGATGAGEVSLPAGLQDPPPMHPAGGMATAL